MIDCILGLQNSREGTDRRTWYSMSGGTTKATRMSLRSARAPDIPVIWIHTCQTIVGKVPPGLLETNTRLLIRDSRFWVSQTVFRRLAGPTSSSLPVLLSTLDGTI